MIRIALIRRKHIWFPTVWGWLALLLLLITACMVTGRYLAFFLAPNDPAPAARILVVEGWISANELNQAITAFRNGKYERIVTTGGPIEKSLLFHGNLTYAELAASYLRSHGLKQSDVIAVPAPASAQERTFLSAVMVRRWIKDKLGGSVAALDVFTSGAHGRRSRMLYRMALGSTVDVGVLSARPDDYDERYWWRTSVGAETVLGETVKLLYTVCFFHPAAKGSEEEMWGRHSGSLRDPNNPQGRAGYHLWISFR